jgi:hypothetical protein
MMNHRKRLLGGEFGEAKRCSFPIESSCSNAMPIGDSTRETIKEHHVESNAINVSTSDAKDSAGDYKGALNRLALRRQ